MNDQVVSFLFLTSRYAHVIAASFLLGGTLFYELIVPVAIDELKDEQKLSVFARTRWAFRWIVWCTAVLLMLSGIVSSYRNWYAYNGTEAAMTNPSGPAQMSHPGALRLEGAGHWWLAHVAVALFAMGVAIGLVRGGRPPRYPLIWMRINLLVLLVTIFLASTTRHLRLQLLESHLSSSASNTTIAD
jgi:hypothetical protein